MAEDEGKIEPSGPAPGPEVPDEERFLSSEKEYPTKEERIRAVEEARRPKGELPRVPPFIETPLSKPNWQPVSEPGPKKVPPFIEGTFEPAPTPPVKTEPRDEGVRKFKEILHAGTTPQETLERTPPIPIPKGPVRPRTIPIPEPTADAKEKPTLQMRAVPQGAPKESFLGRLWNKLRGRS